MAGSEFRPAISVGDPCEAWAYHGYNGIEQKTVAAIKAWIRQNP